MTFSSVRNLLTNSFSSLFSQQHQSTLSLLGVSLSISNVMNHARLAQILAESFSALADEVQSLIDRKTILEHKLRFAHEQVCSRQFVSIAAPANHMMILLALDQ